MRFLNLSLILLLLLPLFCHCVFAAESDAEFSTSDEAKIVGELCDSIQPGSVISDIGLTDETLNGYLSENGFTFYRVILSSTFPENHAARHIIVVGGHSVEDGKIRDTEAERTAISLALLEYRNRQWIAIAKAPELFETGINSNDPEVSLHEISPDHPVLQFNHYLWFSGSSIAITTFCEPSGSSFKEVLSINVSADDCAVHKKCFKYEGELQYEKDSAISLHLKGTYRNGAGKVVPVPSGAIVLQYKDGEFSLSSGSPDLWTAVTGSPWE